MSELSHMDAEGRVAMVDTTGKAQTARRAVRALPVVSTIATRPSASRCVRSLIASAP